MLMAKKRKRKSARQSEQVSLKQATDDEVLAEWTMHLARRKPMKAVAASAVVAITVAIGWVWVHPLVAFLMGLLLLNMLAEFLFPVRYRLTKSDVEVTGFLLSRRMEWKQVRRITMLPDGIHISPFVKPSILDGLRGIFLRWEGDKAELPRLQELCERCQKMARTD